MNSPVNSTLMRLIGEQRKRCLATMFSSAESTEWWRLLEGDEQEAFKEQTRASLAIFYEFVRDVVKVGDDDGMRNEIALDLIRDIHTRQHQILSAIQPNTTGATDG